MFDKRDWLYKSVMNAKYYKVKQYGYGLHETDYAIELRTDIVQSINADQWDRTIAESFAWPAWYCPRTGRMFEGLGGLRNQGLQFNIFNNFHMTYSPCLSKLGKPFASPCDMTINNLITRYELPVFILFGAYHPEPIAFIQKFRGIIRDRKIGTIRVHIPWPIIQLDQACRCFTKILEYEMETCGHPDEISNYQAYKQTIMERS